MDVPSSSSSEEALRRLRLDPDIVADDAPPRDVLEEVSEQEENIPLNVVNFSHRPNAATKHLVESLGLGRIEAFTTRFYELAFADPHLDKFIREREDHHAKRFASWIFEKFGGRGRPWTTERSQRETCPFSSHGYEIDSAFDRSSAHFAAWHSPKRDPRDFGSHFNLADCRRWMRLHFYALRDVGLLETPFGRYYTRFIGHFVSVYERSAPQFTRESARWSSHPTNIQDYLASKDMPDIMQVTLVEALRQLPINERTYTGSNAHIKLWPYDLL